MKHTPFTTRNLKHTIFDNFCTNFNLKCVYFLILNLMFSAISFILTQCAYIGNAKKKKKKCFILQQVTAEARYLSGAVPSSF